MHGTRIAVTRCPPVPCDPIGAKEVYRPFITFAFIQRDYIVGSTPTTSPMFYIHIPTWKELNDGLRVATEKDCAEYLACELSGPRRRTCLLRIHSRLDKLRRARERKELTERSIGR